MKEERKQQLIYCFPAVPNKIKEQMKGERAANFCVFLTFGQELFVRCFHRYTEGEIVERQRYVFAKDGAVRYGFNEQKGWTVMKNFREPVFCSRFRSYSFYNSYMIMNFEAIFKSDMKYCQICANERLPMSYLKLYCKHPNLEYLVKSGYKFLIETKVEWSGGYSYSSTLRGSESINWKSNNLLKMLNLNRTEFKLLSGNEQYYSDYISCRKKYPKYTPEELLMIVKVYGCQFGTMEHYQSVTGVSVKRLARYLCDNNINRYDYADYLRQCKELKYNLKDTAINMPHDFYTMHGRLSEIIKIEADKKARQAFIEKMESRKQFEFDYGNLVLVQPKSIDEIINEGKALEHCVGGYIKRHTQGKTNIFFIRKKSAPNVPYYTIEVSNDYQIIQCRGYKNDSQSEKPQEVIDFEKQYTKFLEELKNAATHRKRTA